MSKSGSLLCYGLSCSVEPDQIALLDQSCPVPIARTKTVAKRLVNLFYICYGMGPEQTALLDQSGPGPYLSESTTVSVKFIQFVA